MKKSLIALLLVLALVITVSVFAVSAEETKTTEKQLWSELTVAADGQTATGYCPHCCADPSESVTWKLYTPAASGHNYPAAGHWFLNASISTNGALWFSTSNMDAVLHLNGKTYTRTNGSSNSTGIICPSGSGAKVSIVDSKAGEGLLTATYGWAIQMSGANSQVDLYSGKVASTMATSHNDGIGGAVRVKKGTFNMHGGAIIDGYNTYGGAIAVDPGATVNLNGGTISGTSAQRGGAVFAYGANATVNVDGATIQDCFATNRCGGIHVTTADKGSTAANPATLNFKSGTIKNCYVAKGSTTAFGGNIYFEFSGGTISGGIIQDGGKPSNAATEYTNASGGNICVRAGNNNNVVVEISGDTLISGGQANNSNGGNLFVSNSAVTISGGTITNGIANRVNGGTSYGQGGNIYADNNSKINISGGVISNTTGKQNAIHGGNIFLHTSALSVTGGTISGGNVASYGGNIYSYGTKLTIDAAEGKTVSITNGKAGSGGNIFIREAANQSTAFSTITGPDVTISGGNATGNGGFGESAAKSQCGSQISLWGVSSNICTLDLKDVTIDSDEIHTDEIALYEYADLRVDGSKTYIDCAYMTDGTSTVTVADGFTGDLWVRWLSNSDISLAVQKGAVIHSSLAQTSGYVGAGTVYACDSGRSQKLLADMGDYFQVASFGGFTIDADGEYVETPLGALPTEEDAYAFVRPYFNDPITLVGDLTLDLNNSTLHVNTNGHKLSMIEMRTDTFADAGDATEGYAKGGYITVDNAANINTVVREKATGNQYITVPVGQTEDGQTKYAAHRVKVDIDSVSIKPATASLYYTTNMDTNPTASQFAQSYGVVLSVVKMPEADFTAGKNGEAYTRLNFAEFADGDRVEVIGTNSALLIGILNQNAPEGQNKAWGEKMVYANAYICFEIDGVEHYVMADKTYELSLLDILTIVNDTNPSHPSVLEMYENWQDPMEQWATTPVNGEVEPRLAAIKEAYDASNPKA